MKLVLFLIGILAVQVVGDCYLHMPRGSNNRLNEKSANRRNGNRLFDSQNNNRGGYNKGDYSTAAAADNTEDQPGTPFTQEINGGQYSEIYYEGSVIPVEWTAQHGCGGSESTDAHKLNCNMVLQYTCNTDRDNTALPDFLHVELKDGKNTNTPDEQNNYENSQYGAAQYDANNANRRGRMESEAWYYDCRTRKRNKGLFTADQKLKGDQAKYTRQNPNGARRGLECPEERDYYPYWHPSPWVDVAYLTDTPQDCTASAPGSFNVEGESQNVQTKFYCKPQDDTDANSRNQAYAAFDEEGCTEANGAWTGFTHGVPKPVCTKAEWSRVNHLGNGRNGQPLMYNWTLPKASVEGLGKYTQVTANGLAKCVMRMRYNISTDDYDPRATNSSMNHNKNAGVTSPVQQNPTVDIGASLQGLKLAINTAQFGRTFQDRSHTFYIKKAPATVGGAKILNLQARGKRGNIVQTFPSVEYDFQPNILEVTSADFIHVQWTGSNTHNNGNPAGDGQAGDAGEGTGGTDRHNIACLDTRADNYPVPIDNAEMMENSLYKQFDCFKPTTGTTGYMNYGVETTKMDWKDCAAYLATGGYYKTDAEVAANENDMNNLLNNVPPSLHAGILLKPKKAGAYHYMNTRNNNFSNRSQKATIIVK